MTTTTTTGVVFASSVVYAWRSTVDGALYCWRVRPFDALVRDAVVFSWRGFYRVLFFF